MFSGLQATPEKHGGICWQPKLSSIKICGINAKMSSLAPKLIFYTSLACICIVQDPGIVARHIKHYLQRDTKMSQNRFQDGVKLLIWMHQDEALIEMIETDIWMTLFRVRMRKLWWCEVCYPAKTGYTSFTYRSDQSTLLEIPRRSVLLTGLTGLQYKSPDYARNLSLGRSGMCFWLPKGVYLPTLYIWRAMVDWGQP
jgi:hypothetical protein